MYLDSTLTATNEQCKQQKKHAENTTQTYPTKKSILLGAAPSLNRGIT